MLSHPTRRSHTCANTYHNQVQRVSYLIQKQKVCRFPSFSPPRPPTPSLLTLHSSPDILATVTWVPAWPMSTNTATLVGSPAFCWRVERKEGRKVTYSNTLTREDEALEIPQRRHMTRDIPLRILAAKL